MNKIDLNIYTERWKKSYETDIKLFLDEIKDLKKGNLPQPFLPIHGESYGDIKPKIVFCGWETRGCKDLEEWYIQGREDIGNILFFNDEFLHLDFTKWRTNFGNDFWSFNLKILSRLHSIEDWRDMYRNPNDYREILTSFVWANTDSVERFNVTAKNQGCKQEDWLLLKNASSKFDSFEKMINLYEPNIVIIEHWDFDENWLHRDIKFSRESEPDKFIWIYEIEKYGTKVFCVPHPRGHKAKGIDSDAMVEKLINLLK